MSTPDLLATLRSVTPDEHRILITLALDGTSLARSNFVACMKAANWRRTNGVAFNNDNLGVSLKALHDRKLITFTSYATMSPELAWVVLLGEPRAALEPMVTALRQYSPLTPKAPDALQRELNLALLDRDLVAVERLIGFARRHRVYALEAGKAGLFGDLPSAALKHIHASPSIMAVYYAETLRVARQQLRRDDASLAALEALAGQQRLPLLAVHELCRHWILRRRADDTALLGRLPSDDDTSPALACWVAHARGEVVTSEQLQQALAAPKRTSADGPTTLPGPELVVLELLCTAQRVQEHSVDPTLLLGCREVLDQIARVVAGGELDQDLGSSFSYRATPEQSAWQAVCGVILGALAPESGVRHRGGAMHPVATEAGYPWLGDALNPKPPKGAPGLAALFSPTPVWQRKLERLEKALATLAPAPPPAARAKQAPEEDVRLVWLLEATTYGVRAHPREQRRDARGKWSKGRRVALEHLFGARPEYKPLTAADRAICAFIQQEVHIVSGYRNISYSLDETKGFTALAAHPHVSWLDDDAQRIVFREAEPSLHIERGKSGAGEGFKLRLEPRVHAAGEHLVKTGPYEVTRIRASDMHERLGEILGAGLDVPASQAQRVEHIVAAVTGVIQVHSDLTGHAQATQSAADARPVVQLTPLTRGLSVRLQVRPLGSEGPAVVPGQGGRALSVVHGGKTVLVQRDLAAELAQVDAVLAACPALFAGDAAEGGWQVADPAAALELLLQLEALGTKVVVEWPAGKPLKVLGTVDGKALSLKIAAAGGWFALSGELTIDPEHVLEIGELLRLVADTPHRFIALGPDRFIALTARLRDQLASIAGLAEPRRGHVALHPWAGVALESLAEEAGALSAVAAWKKAVIARREAAQLVPVVPRTLKASLRDYQVDGFRWLARLAHLGAGACLADDMGLGKTLQTLALLVYRAEAGAQLVVCPTSVIGGWLDEAARFAPTLRLTLLSAASDRVRAIAEAGPFDVLVVSYGLLQSESEVLAGRRWETVVLDEAQAIKNAQTQRAAAAYALDAAFRVALTGTPVENRLEDLWAIFNFVVPGFLGTRARFVERYVRPEAEQARPARQALKQLVSPLLLRRTKGEVLTELPARTEMVVRVTQGAREAALYEALRQRALTSLAAHAAEPSGQRRVRVLAEITRLRRACCHPRLVLKATDAPDLGELGALTTDGAKLAAFAELLDELRQGGHRALVYSQFVDHLEIVREWVASQAIPYQYLDGSTPQKQRQERVRAFQAGEGELFLISLRAGGAGLNLTGADFVIHLDPWWNPAVEDQASDRVYRIGQERPVTIVRLVVRGSIEERILDLHRTKRELADDLLADSEGAARLDVDGLVALLQGP